MVVYVTFRPGTIRGQRVGVSFFYYYLGMYDQYLIIRYIYLFTDNHVMIKIPLIQGMYDQYKYFPAYVDAYSDKYNHSHPGLGLRETIAIAL